MDLSGMRIDYDQGQLDEEGAGDLPLQLFTRWWNEAVRAEVPEPNAMTLATVGADGRPSTRVLLLKSFDAEGLVFFTNYRSRKGLELEQNPAAALQFHWVEQQRVVRVEGTVAKVSEAESDEYFAQRPLDSRIGAWASPQSEVISSRAQLLTAAAAVAARHMGNPPRPPHWGGYRLVPDTWEFWQGRRSRLHDRIRWSLRDGTWCKERLAP